MPPSQATRSIAELISDTAYRLSRAAAVRYVSSNTCQESSRDVYLASCAAIGKHLEESYGFKYAKSGPHARRRCGEFTFEVWFQSSSHNVAGQHVGLFVNACIRSTKLKKWRETHALKCPNDIVAGVQIGNLRPDLTWRNWELADPIQRENVIRDAIQAIEEVTFPFFAKFEDLPALCESLVSEPMPGTINSAIELLLCFTDHATTRAAAVNWLKQWPKLMRKFTRDFQRFAERGLESDQYSGYVNLAWAAHRFQFGDLTKEL